MKKAQILFNRVNPCKGRSKAEFIAKLGIVEEEADESAYWMELIIEGNLLQKSAVEPLLKEANEIVAIMAASRKSASVYKPRKEKDDILKRNIRGKLEINSKK